MALDDVPADATQAAAIGRLAERGIVRGDNDDRFNRADPVTPATVAERPTNAMEIVTGQALPRGDLPFTDVPVGSAHADGIAKLYGIEVVNGTSATTYQPSASIARAQAAAILARLLNRITAEQALA